MLNKSDILNGAKTVEKRKLETLNLGALYFRKLSDGELAEVQSIVAKGSRFSGQVDDKDDETTKMELDATTAILNSRRARYEAIAKSLNNEKNNDSWTPEDIEKLPGDVVDEMSEIVAEISGVLGRRAFRKWKREKVEDKDGTDGEGDSEN